MRVPPILPIFTVAVLLLATAWTNSRAHEGEDHDESRPISVAVSAAPRVEAASERFELVAIANSGSTSNRDLFASSRLTVSGCSSFPV